MKYLSDIRIVIAIAAVVVLIIIWFIVQKIRSNKFRHQLEELEVRYNTIKSVPLSFKLNKAVAISRVEPDTMQKVTQTKDDFDKAEANLKQISQQLADTEDEILAGKLKKVKPDLADLEASISLGEQQVSSLDKFLDSILEKETAQRQEVTELKNHFRDLRNTAAENQSQLSYIWPTIEQNISDTEKMFSAFEEWMYASDFEKANAELDNIRESISRLESMIQSLPDLLSDARGVVPKMAEVLHQDYTTARDGGVYLDHLQIDKNLKVITAGLKEDLAGIKDGNLNGVREHLDDYKVRLTQMDQAVKKESESFMELKKFAGETETLFHETERNAKYIDDLYARLKPRLGLSDMEERIGRQKDRLATVSAKMPKVFQMYQENQSPASSVMASMKELNQEITVCNSGFKELRAEIDNTAGGEDRARKQLVKLQVIMNQMQVKIRKYKLPSISQQYEEDMAKANEYIHSIDRLINAPTLNVQLLSSTLKEAIDFIYKLYNNVNNVVATVIMVENTIVFGNRYRSTYADIDSELTRSELCFRNGEYTQALSIAIATIEKIHPGNYENMIKENAKSAA
ncbi:MAG: septation ring formation regulator EzrA [Stecheria intestinalis]|uniref:septation ring formation regulator EzrA n=1 Tax=Stecheria intestinalis TaxID=2606630 RepID=UPI0023F2F0C5|nr:septation ring formation regulator EzrA [Stecheria intestinalis]MCI6746303.1 septation ring formation regulator EzrA [Anaerolactibacter massiliensis]MDD5880735.1 septation ring formation regulator EzrA [Stecheria intestinalis]MDD6366568.1 septation ring formation regulator EzrA [Stecheria intestinalis]